MTSWHAFEDLAKRQSLIGPARTAKVIRAETTELAKACQAYHIDSL